MKNPFTILIISLLILIGCSQEFELQKSVFIYDPDYPGLPQYSEWGYNTFGAYYDRQLFISNDSEMPMKVIVTNNTTTFLFKGQKSSYDYYQDIDDMSIKYGITDFLPESYFDLLQLNDTIFNLEDPVCDVEITINDVSFDAEILNGTLEFKRAQQLFVDTEQVEVILSGIFEFRALINDEPVSVSCGRFDVGIGTNNFFYY